MTVQALLFDFDGLILDTETSLLTAWTEEYAAAGIALDPATWHVAVGFDQPAADRLAELAAARGAGFDAEAAHRRCIDRHHELIRGEELRPGILDYLAEADRLGLRSAVVSSSPMWWLREHLGRFDLIERFAFLCAGDEVERTKPFPDLYRLALDRLEIGPGSAIALEDSIRGVGAAKAAGIYCVAIPNAVTVGQSFVDADLVLPSCLDLPLAELIAGTQSSPASA